MKTVLKNIVVQVLTHAATLALKRHNPKIIAITGSVGKTTTKDVIAYLLKDEFTLRKSEKSFNSELGVPLAVLGLSNAWGSAFGWALNIVHAYTEVYGSSFPKLLVLEVGADHPNDIKKIAAWLKPDIAVITRLPDVPVHVEFFPTPEDVWNEKAELVKALKSNSESMLIYNGDDAHMNVVLAKTPPQVKQYSYGITNAGVTLKASAINISTKAVNGHLIPVGMEWKSDYKSTSIPMKIFGVVGDASISSAISGTLVALQVGLSSIEVAERLQTLRMPNGRMHLLQGVNNSTLIDDTYNASPVATESALRTLKTIPATRRIAFLGDMRELGAYSEREHQRMGKLAGEICDVVIGVGEESKVLIEEVKKQKKITQWFATSTETAVIASSLVNVGDVVLVKGSQGARMEKITQALLEDQRVANEVLVRQEKEWKNR